MPPRLLCFNGASLFRARKLEVQREREVLETRLQWGLTLSSEETYWIERVSFSGGGLQWGLTLSSEETRRTAFRFGRAASASMGPHSFERGNQAGSPTDQDSITRFNGASLFRARKHGVTTALYLRQNCFNGASLFRARKRVHESSTMQPDTVLQWGLTLSSEETFGNG